MAIAKNNAKIIRQRTSRFFFVFFLDFENFIVLISFVCLLVAVSAVVAASRVAQSVYQHIFIYFNC